jgi:heme/copper-type cytochrome/quinol oxidase subunit 2
MNEQLEQLDFISFFLGVIFTIVVFIIAIIIIDYRNRGSNNFYNYKDDDQEDTK